MTEAVTPAVLSPDLRRTAERIVAKYPNKRSAALPLLFLVLSAEGYVSDAGMREVADILDLTPAEVLATASFYSMLKRKPQGKYLISVCRNISCTHLGAREVIAAVGRRLGIEPGETTADGTFSLEVAECLATCDGAPAVQVNYEDFYRVTPDLAVDIIDRLERGEEVESSRGQRVRTYRKAAFETATAGLRHEPPEGPGERTVGGESPPPDMAPGFRPPVLGTQGGDRAG